MRFLQFCTFESAARAGDGEDAPPLCSGSFVDPHAVDATEEGDAMSAVVKAVEAAWCDLGSEMSGNPMVPMLLSPMHKLRLFFCTAREGGPAVSQSVTDGVTALTEQLMAEQVADAAKLQAKDAGIRTAPSESAWPYNPALPSLLLVNAVGVARTEGDALVVNPQTPVRDWFRILNHSLAREQSPIRLIPLLTTEGTPTSEPRYAAVDVATDSEYFATHQELREFGVTHQRDPGLQWQVLCDHTKLIAKQMSESGEAVRVRTFVMSLDRSLRGVLMHNYTEKHLSALREKFGTRLMQDDA